MLATIGESVPMERVLWDVGLKKNSELALILRFEAVVVAVILVGVGTQGTVCQLVPHRLLQEEQDQTVVTQDQASFLAGTMGIVTFGEP